MDFYKYVNSKDIMAYLKEIKYKFSQLEKAFLVYQSHNYTIEEKLKAYQWIIDNEKDCSIEKRYNCNYYPSLKKFIIKYINVIKKLIKSFYNENDKYTYTGQFCYESDQDWCDCDYLTNNFDNLKKHIFNITKDNSLKSFNIRKNYLNKHNEYITLYFDKNGKIMDIDFCNVLNKEENDIMSAFEGMWFDIPTPFKKGDLLTYIRNPYWPNKNEYPLVLERLTSWSYEKNQEDGYKELNDISKDLYDAQYEKYKKNGDYTDMCAVAYFISSGMFFYSDYEPGYLNLEYYKGDIKNEIRLLNALSLYIKDEIDSECLQKAISIIKQQEKIRKEISTFNYLDEVLKMLKI